MAQSLIVSYPFGMANAEIDLYHAVTGALVEADISMAQQSSGIVYIGTTTDGALVGPHVAELQDASDNDRGVVWFFDLQAKSGNYHGKTMFCPPVYDASLRFEVDDANGQDEYSCVWTRDLIRESDSNCISLPKIQVIKRTDGTDLIAKKAMTEVVTGIYKYDATTSSGAGSANERMTAGQSVTVLLFATIDGVEREVPIQVGRDTSA